MKKIKIEMNGRERRKQIYLITAFFMPFPENKVLQIKQCVKVPINGVNKIKYIHRKIRAKCY